MSNFDVLAGVIIAAHGVQGAVKLRLSTKTSLQLISTGTSVSRKPADVWIGKAAKTEEPSENDAEGHFATITQVKELLAGGMVYLIKIQNVRDRNQAEKLIGSSVFAPESRRAPLADDEYFVEQLIGLQVVGDTGQDYGKITTVLPQPANDVYETDQGALIPAVKAFVKEIDVPAGRIVVYDVPGLRPSEAEEVASTGHHEEPEEE